MTFCESRLAVGTVQWAQQISLLWLPSYGFRRHPFDLNFNEVVYVSRI